MKTRLKKIFQRFLYGFYLICFVLLAGEIIYRTQLIDLYSAEFQALNPNIQAGKPNILVIGDSFTASQENWLEVLRQKYPQYNWLNAAIPGTGPYEQGLILHKKVAQYKPEWIIWQIYVGNDLLDLHKPIDWEKLSFARNLYWFLSQKLHFLAWINHKLVHIRWKTGNTLETLKPSVEDTFSPAKYSAREKLLLEADAAYLQKTACLEAPYDDYFADFCNSVEHTLKTENYGEKVSFLILPHCVQVAKSYHQNLQILGAKLEKSLPCPSLLAEKMQAHFPQSKVWNAADTLIAAEEKQVLQYYANDPHLNPVGQKTVGEWLKRHLVIETP